MSSQDCVLPFYQLRGEPEEIGHQHGTLLKDRIHECYEFYTKTLFDKPNFDFKKHGLRFLEIITNYHEPYGREIKALAEAAEMEPWQIAVLNARSEIFLVAKTELTGECTALFFEEAGLLGQNWDWMTPCERFMVLLEIENTQGQKILTMTEAGILGKVGFNDAGLGVCLNILLGDQPYAAAPIHIMLRRVMECRTLEEVQQEMDRADAYGYSNMLIAQADGAYMNLEFMGKTYARVAYDQIPVHTNHFLNAPIDQQDIPPIVNSKTRLNRAKSLIAELNQPDLDDMIRVLLDKENGPDAICKAYAPMWDTEHGTICSLVMDLKTKTLHITKGSPYHQEFVSHAL